MRLELKLAWRFLRGTRRSLARFTSIAAIAGIAAGVACLILAQAIGGGFQTELQEKILASTPHITVFRDDGKPISNWPKIANSIRNVPGVRQVDASTYDSSVLTGPEGSAYAVIRVQLDDDLDDDTVRVGSELAKRTGMNVGDFADIIGFSDVEAGRSVRLRVQSLIATGLYEYDSTRLVISPEGYAKHFGGGVLTPSVLEIYADDPAMADPIAIEIGKIVNEGDRVLSWTEANRPLFAALSFERRAAAAVLILIILIAAVNITTTVAMMVNERRSDIAILRTNGANLRSLVTVFLAAGVALGVIGTVLGTTFGLIAIAIINYFGLLSLPADVYSISSFVLRPTVVDVLIAVAGALLICLIAALVPAVSASRFKPLENLRS